MASKDRKEKKAKKRKRPIVRDKHLLYTAAVQSVGADLDFFRRVYKRKNGAPFRLLREDFCGTAALACEWARRRSDHRAWGIDLDARTLDWGRAQYVPRLGKAADRVELIQGNVMDAPCPPVDVVAALNFSYCVFKKRSDLREYFRRAREALRPGGLFFLDAFGGTEAVIENEEDRRIPKSVAFDGTKMPAFTYVWDQARYNPIDHNILCHIHFELADGRRLSRAFTYDWRLWTPPELTEILGEAGFAGSEVYMEGWDDEEDDTDGIFRRRTKVENQSGWVAYVVGLT